jgi:hypothetical protein
MAPPNPFAIFEMKETVEFVKLIGEFAPAKIAPPEFAVFDVKFTIASANKRFVCSFAKTAPPERPALLLEKLIWAPTKEIEDVLAETAPPDTDARGETAVFDVKTIADVNVKVDTLAFTTPPEAVLMKFAKIKFVKFMVLSLNIKPKFSTKPASRALPLPSNVKLSLKGSAKERGVFSSAALAKEPNV